MASVENEIQRGLLDFYKRRFASRGSARIPYLAKISDGWENEVYSFALEYAEPEEPRREDLILRIYPGDHAPQKAAREFNGMKKLHELGFPVPEVLILELEDSPFGKPFVIMERIDGKSMASVLDESDEAKRQELIALFCRMFVDLHALDWKLFVPDPSVYETDDPYTFAHRRISRAQWYIDHFHKHEFQPVVDWLEERSSDVPCELPSVIHLDYHPHNVLMRDDGRAFVIDWTNIEVADPRLDLAWTIVLTSNYGNPEAREIVLDGYEKIADRKIQQIEYFEVAASLRRLLSISVSISEGADKLGMRPEAVKLMRRNVGHISSVHSFLHDRTGINIPEIETMISEIS